MDKIKLNTVEEAVEDFRKGEFVIVVDDEDRENEGDLIIAAELITPEKVNFMLKHARGVLCAPITISRCKELDLPHQVEDNTSVLGTPFTITGTSLKVAPLVSPLQTEPPPYALSQTRHLHPLHSADRVTSTPFMPKTKASFVVPGIQKPASTWQS